MTILHYFAIYISTLHFQLFFFFHFQLFNLIKLFMCSYWSWICFAVFSLFNIYLLIWLGWVLLVVRGILLCGAQTLIAVQGLSCPAANGIFPDQGSNRGSRERTLAF